MPEPTERAKQVNRFKEFVRSHGYEFVVSDSGVSIEELLESFESICGLKMVGLHLTNEITKEMNEDETD